MPDIRRIERVERDDLEALITGYTAHERYEVSRTESDASTVFRLELIRLEAPFVKTADVIDNSALKHYQAVAEQGMSLGVYEEDHLIALALAETNDWNHSLYVHEFRVADGYRGQGIGLALMAALVERCREAGLRVIVCETQNTNVPSIRFYRRAGFTLDGIEFTLYTDDAGSEDEIAIFMKRKL